MLTKVEIRRQLDEINKNLVGVPAAEGFGFSQPHVARGVARLNELRGRLLTEETIEPDTQDAAKFEAALATIEAAFPKGHPTVAWASVIREQKAEMIKNPSPVIRSGESQGR